jgi:hypothetical protein
MPEDELKRLLAEGKTARARQLMRERELGISAESRLLGPVTGLLFFLAVLTAITVAVIYGMRFLAPVAFPWLGPLLDPVASWLAPLLLSPTGLMILGLIILAVGLPRAGRFRRPGRFRGGIIALALAFTTFWPLQFLVSRIEVPFWEFKMALHLFGGFISICMLTGGLEAIRMANNTPRDDSWEFLN